MADETTGPKTGNSDKDGPAAPADNPRELLNSANSAAGQARTSWFAFLGLVAYMIVAVGSVSHVDLLLDRRLRLPVVNVEIPLTGFFVLAPLLLVLVHLALLVQHVMLAHKYHYFTRAIAASETDRPRSHPDRRLVHSYVFAQLLAGPQPSVVLELMMRGMVWITFSFLPIATLLFFQVTFLPYHDVMVTHLQRAALVLDILLLLVLPPLFCFPSLLNRTTAATEWVSEPGRQLWCLRLSRAGLECGPSNWPWRMRYRHVAAAFVVTGIVFTFSFLIATVPASNLDSIASPQVDKPSEGSRPVIRASFASAAIAQPTEANDNVIDTAARGSPSRDISCTDPDNPDAFYFEGGNFLHCLKEWLFEGDPDFVRSKPRSFFGRNIIIIDTDMSDAPPKLRGRDLRNAHMDRSQLPNADLTAANFRNTSLRFANLTGAKIACTDACIEKRSDKETYCYEPVQDQEQCDRATLAAEIACFEACPDLRNTNMEGADLQKTDFHGSDLQGANLTSATLSSAILAHTKLSNVVFAGANLQKVQFVQADLSGLNLRAADLQWAVLSTDTSLKGADLSGADLRSAILTSVDLTNANLQNANLRCATLFDVSWQNANLLGVELEGAVLLQTDLREADLPAEDLERMLREVSEGPDPKVEAECLEHRRSSEPATEAPLP